MMAVSLLLPWGLRRWWLARFFGYEIHPTARIGRSWVMPGKLVMEAGARIGSGTVCKGLELVEMQEGAHLGNLNWVTGVAEGWKAGIFCTSPSGGRSCGWGGIRP